eukprot:gene11824-11968_t
MSVSAEEIADVIRSKRDDFLREKESLSLKQIRRIVEKSLKLEKKVLDGQKALVEQLVDQIVLNAAPEDGVQSKASKPKNQTTQAPTGKKRKADVILDDQQDSDEDDFCQPKQNTINKKAAAVQNKDPASLRSALQDLLSRHGLKVNSDASKIASVKAKLELAKDMEGIDMSNIIDDTDAGRGGRPSRRAAAKVDYKSLLKAEEELEDEESDGDEDQKSDDSQSSEDGSEVEVSDDLASEDAAAAGSDDEDEPPQVARRNTSGTAAGNKGRHAAASESDEDVAEDDELGDDSGGEEQVNTLKQKTSKQQQQQGGKTGKQGAAVANTTNTNSSGRKQRNAAVEDLPDTDDSSIREEQEEEEEAEAEQVDRDDEEESDFEDVEDDD